MSTFEPWSKPDPDLPSLSTADGELIGKDLLLSRTSARAYVSPCLLLLHFLSESMYVADAEMYGLYMTELLQNIFNTFSIRTCLLAHWTCPQNLIKVGI